ncbi:reverse transcriptase domain-containing protein [Tanacetum coccineum]|uniref:Reverse transcriptase domain-containing protein n=1 Tax=Tanacetum coccineum TaxID=301880 RepID=A0ABQ4YKQ6_9ASTR
MFKKIYFNISFAKALAHMPKFAKMVKDLLTNKEKLLEWPNTPLNENCSAVLLKKLPEKLGDTGRFLIPCDFYGLESCMALADLGASINLMPLFIPLSLPEITPTRMILELATRTVAYPAGITEDVFLQVGKFTFSADFVVVDYDVDPRLGFLVLLVCLFTESIQLLRLFCERNPKVIPALEVILVKGMVKTCEWYLGSLGGKMSFIEVGDERGKLLEVDFDFDFVRVDFSVDFLTLTVSSRSFHSRARFCPF